MIWMAGAGTPKKRQDIEEPALATNLQSTSSMQVEEAMASSSSQQETSAIPPVDTSTDNVGTTAPGAADRPKLSKSVKEIAAEKDALQKTRELKAKAKAKAASKN